MDLDLRDELDRCFGDGPVHPSLELALDAGHRALRRRRRQRFVVGVAAAAAIAAVGVWRVSDTPTSDRPPVAVPGSADRDTASHLWRDLDPVPQFELVENQAFFDSDGVVLVRPGATVVQRNDDPVPSSYADHTVSLISRTDGQTYWSYLYWRTDHTGGSSSVRPEEAHGATFAEWVDAEAARTELSEPSIRYVAFRHDGSLRGVGGAEIVAQTADVPARIAPTGSTAAVALVSVGDARLCAYARRIGTRDPEYIYLNGAGLGSGLGCVATMGGWD